MSELEHIISRWNGLFVGQIDNDEDRALLDLAIEKGLARIVYEGAAGFMGLGKIRAT